MSLSRSSLSSSSDDSTAPSSLWASEPISVSPSAIRTCPLPGCSFRGDLDTMTRHSESAAQAHIELLIRAEGQARQECKLHKQAMSFAQTRCRALEHQNEELRARIQQLHAQLERAEPPFDEAFAPDPQIANKVKIGELSRPGTPSRRRSPSPQPSPKRPDIAKSPGFFTFPPRNREPLAPQPPSPHPKHSSVPSRELLEMEVTRLASIISACVSHVRKEGVVTDEDLPPIVSRLITKIKSLKRELKKAHAKLNKSMVRLGSQELDRLDLGQVIQAELERPDGSLAKVIIQSAAAEVKDKSPVGLQEVICETEGFSDDFVKGGSVAMDSGPKAANESDQLASSYPRFEWKQIHWQPFQGSLSQTPWMAASNYWYNVRVTALKVPEQVPFQLEAEMPKLVPQERLDPVVKQNRLPHPEQPFIGPMPKSESKGLSHRPGRFQKFRELLRSRPLDDDGALLG